MVYSDTIPQISTLGRFINFIANPATFVNSISDNRMFSYYPHKKDDELVTPEDFPVPDGDEINPNKDVPKEEEYLPDEQEVPIEEPIKEIEEDPYFPRREDGLPPAQEEEFPKTDPD
ncbi:hypothetical protein LV84_03235 [Algoriphagus ratkowskyi]|uniref:Uncharacterized protein n=1 Tax=Algoriphagus ratkowskyi TaxID=57028 RepID=A0A2W7R028_9BACT|nr:hypothetical protein [Algoriphagus ratkowskyi]PZX53511.1 hypothetical protein LV84_03235 [Algoriphagus ratkowskyi]TXD76460.1 hypothetical protein ESW18_15735 [Algoriphagus ratkowskyi]